MTDGPSTAELVSLLSSRTKFLDELAATRREKRELVERLDVSRSTVDRALRELEMVGLVEQSDGTFGATATGRLAVEEYDRFANVLDDVASARRLLGTLPPDVDIDVALVEDAEVLLSDGPAPHSPLLSVEENVSEASAGWGFSRAVTQPRFIDLFYERTTAGDLAFEMIYERAVLEHVLSTYPAKFAEMVEDGEFRVLVVESLPFGMGLFELDDRSEVDVIVYDDRELTGVVRNDASGAVEWARARYERVRERATDVSEDVASGAMVDDVDAAIDDD